MCEGTRQGLHDDNNCAVDPDSGLSDGNRVTVRRYHCVSMELGLSSVFDGSVAGRDGRRLVSE